MTADPRDEGSSRGEPKRQRVLVTHPRTVATRVRASAYPVPDADPVPIGELALRSLMRAQLRLSLRYLAGVALLLAGVPLLLVHVSFLSSHRVFGVPLSWVVVGCGMFPLLVVLAYGYDRRVQRIEDDFVVVVEQR